MKIRYNVLNITSIMTFASVKGGLNQSCKDAYFITCIGHDGHYLTMIEQMDRMLSGREDQNLGKYIRLTGLSGFEGPEEISFYRTCYDQWVQSGKRRITGKNIPSGKELEEALKEAMEKTTAKFKECSPGASESMESNFIIKLMHWLDRSVCTFLTDWNERGSYKFVFSGAVKNQEYLFFYFLTLLGIDVMVLMPEGNKGIHRSLLELSAQLVLGSCSPAAIPPYDRRKYKELPGGGRSSGFAEQDAAVIRPQVSIKQPETGRKAQENSRCEKNFEELAMAAASVVMIAVHDQAGNVTATGSGIIISAGGYILTNHHVVSGGAFYTVRFEEDKELYRTDEVIKDNSFLDLALIRINGRILKPIPIYRGTDNLVRGQKVVAIGSPLGMFNSVSDGIISGFRTIDDVEMIQFTAPISHGSSGGALMNLYGEIIGISTAGFDRGQNLNLAVGYEDIHRFTHGFL